MTPLRILIVEDEALVARDLSATLARMGYVITCVASTGFEALRSASEVRPDIALMDIRLGDGGDGIDTAKLLHQEFSVPVVYLTAYADDETLARAKETQPYGYLLKPFHESELRSVIEMAVTRHQANVRLIANENLFVNTLRSMKDGVISTDLLGKINYLNPVAESLTGWPAVEALGRPLHDVFQVAQASGQQVDALGLSQSGERRSLLLKTRLGETILIEDNTGPSRDAEGGLSGIVVVFRKQNATSAVTLRGVTESELPNLAGIVQSIVDPLISLDADWKITYLNEPATRALSDNRESSIGKDFWDCVPLSLHRRYYHEFSQARTRQQTRSFEMEFEASQIWYEVQLYPFDTGLLALLRDITKRKETEEQERKLEKLESLGLLARGFAHDFNNLLTILIGNISLAEMQIPRELAGYAEVLTAKQASIQAQGLVQHLLTFARGGSPVKQPTDFGRLVRDWAHDWSRLDGIDYQIEITESLMQADLDRKQFLRLIHNLFRNAEQAIFQTGQVKLRLCPLHEASPTTLPPDLNRQTLGDNWLLLQVIDDGQGIADEALPHVFEPYFSTRVDANASGLGLTVCESIAKAHGAKIFLQTKLEEGTTVSVLIPSFHSLTHDSRAEIVPVPAPEPKAEAPNRRVLILEDEPLIRALMCATLRNMDCEVDQTSDGAETIVRYQDAYQCGQPYQLLIMDLSIPNGMGGLQAMDQILQFDPDARAIVSSGYCDDPVLSRYMDYGFCAVLPKPYQPQELKHMVESMLTK